MYFVCVTVFRMCEHFRASRNIFVIMWFVCLFVCLFVLTVWETCVTVTLICLPDCIAILRVMYLCCVELFKLKEVFVLFMKLLNSGLVCLHRTRF
jgi:hypothetical protein